MTAQLPKMTREDWLGILILTLVIAVISFARLGDRVAPQTSWVPAQGDIAEISFGEAVQITSMQYRMGARHDQIFSVYYSYDGAEWKQGYIVTSHPRWPNVFYWTRIPMQFTARYARVTAVTHDLRLQEIAFRGTDDELLPIAYISENAHALTDEQHMVPERRTFMNSTYFDEIYHPRTAYEFVHRLRVYETTHPPLGKAFQALSVRIFGMTPWAWRLPGTLFGVLMVPLMYAFARAMFASNKWALFAAVVFGFDFMRFTQTRLATIDTYVTFFIIAMYFCMFLYVREVKIYAQERRNYSGNLLRRTLIILAVCGAMMGLAIASKWQGVYGAVGLPLLFFPALYTLYTTEPRRNKRLTKITVLCCFAFFVAVPVMIYALSYIPFVLAQGYGWRAAWDNQQHMFSYHAHLVAEHGFASRWWSWPIMLRPLWLYVNRISPEINAGMSTLGNPAVWWFGIIATITMIVHMIKSRKDKRAPRKNDMTPYHLEKYIPVFLLVAYAVQFLPWVPVTRLTFIYHYFPSVPFIVLIITWFFRKYVHRKAIIYSYCGVVIGLFALFYPVLSGLPMRVDFVRTWLSWLPGWVFM